VRNPLPAVGGTVAESVAEVQLRAPHAFRSVLARAVTTADYEAIIRSDFGSRVQRAAAQVTGQADNRTQIALRLDPIGGRVDERLREAVATHVERYRRIGHVLTVADPIYVPIDLTLEVDLQPHYRWGAVLGVLRDRFGNHELGDGTRGFFHPDELTFGDGIAVSAVVAAAMSVPGVARVKVVALRRHGVSPDLPAGDYLSVEPSEVCRLDNDPDVPANGVLTIKRRKPT
jgi:predicted phage baseplate assembly protein